jgi:hypothetical protein
MFSITCQCGHTDDFDTFTTTPLGFNRPPGEYQCRACGFAWKIEREPGKFYFDGQLYIPGKGHLTAIQPELSAA